MQEKKLINTMSGEVAAGHSVLEGGEMKQPRGAYPEGVRGVGHCVSTSLL